MNDEHHGSVHSRAHSQTHPGWRHALAHRVRHAIRPHSHDHGTDAALEASADGWRTLWISLAALAVTAGAQAVVVALSGSVALLGDTLHNAADALTAVPIGMAFLLGRRRPTRRYTYGYGRAEDLAGIAIVVVIAISCAVAAFAAVQRLAAPAAGHPPGRRGHRGCPRFRRQRTGGPLPDQDRPPDRFRRAGRRRPGTPVPTGSPHWPSWPGRAGWRSAGPGPTP